MLDWASKLTRQEQRDHDASLPSDVSVLPPTEFATPKSGVALALGGGAARGWAHIGVLRAICSAIAASSKSPIWSASR